MPRQRHEVRLDRSMAETFDVLTGVVGRNRWLRQFTLEPADAVPRPGLRYEQQRGSVLRRGRVLECIRPVSITLHETLRDPPCCVRIWLGWRLEPLDTGSFLRLHASFDLNGAAALRRRHWNGQISAHCGRMIAALVARLEELGSEENHFSGVSGQKTGSSSMTDTKVSTDSGKPTFT